MDLERITRPTLVLDQKRTVENIRRMANKASSSNVIFRPHFKTHQSVTIGQWFRDNGVSQITVSSLDMALYFAADGWADITVAIPVNLRQIDQINTLARKIKLNLVVETVEVVQRLNSLLQHDVVAWLKVDAGYGRTGIVWNDRNHLPAVVEAVQLAPMMHLAGLLTHSGQTYHSDSPSSVVAAFAESVEKIILAKESVSHLTGDLHISVGDTPGCSLVERFEGVDEIRPGNFIFFDTMQLKLGSCREEDIAVAVFCPVIAKHQRRNQIVIYGGAVHLSKESNVDEQKIANFGLVCLPSNTGWSHSYPNSFVSALSQEHGIIQAGESLFNDVNVGNLVAILPVHSCLSADLYGQYLTLENNSIQKFRGN
jgi:D-serine deaminase-like pyridoxal phosphate-dependent protein